MIYSTKLLSTTVNATGAPVPTNNPGGTFQASLVGTGVISCSVAMQATLDLVNWVTLGTLSLSDTVTTGTLATTGTWLAYRAVASAVTPGVGTITSITAYLGQVV